MKAPSPLDTNPPVAQKRGWKLPLFWIVLACSISAFWGISISLQSRGFLDFKAVYLGTQCLLQGHNPYDQSQLLAVYKAAGGAYKGELPDAVETVTRYVNLPPAFLLMLPFSLLPFGLANSLWIAISAAALVCAAFLMWRAASSYSPPITLLLMSLLLANAQIAFEVGNTATLVVGMCVIASWCFVEGRFTNIGVLCIAISLAVKPHDAGWIWLYFLMFGGAPTRKALKAVSITSAMAVASLIWVWHVVPQWVEYWRLNMAHISAPGGLNEPGPYSISSSCAGMVIDLQAALRVFTAKPTVLNGLSYLICGTILLAWAWRTVKVRGNNSNIWLGLAALVSPTLLITYHRGYDAKLLLLTIPACAMLWSRRGVRGFLAVFFTLAAILSSADVPLTGWIIYRNHLAVSTTGIFNKLLAVLVLEPTPVFLLAMGLFYIWVYVKDDEIERTEAHFSVRESERTFLPAGAVAELRTSAH